MQATINTDEICEICEGRGRLLCGDVCYCCNGSGRATVEEAIAAINNWIANWRPTRKIVNNPIRNN